MPEYAVAGKFGERDLGDQLRLHPMRIPRGRSGHPHRRRLAPQRFELSLETFHFIIAETGADLACIAHPPTLVEPEQQRTEPAHLDPPGQAHDEEYIPLVGFGL